MKTEIGNWAVQSSTNLRPCPVLWRRTGPCRRWNGQKVHQSVVTGCVFRETDSLTTSGVQLQFHDHNRVECNRTRAREVDASRRQLNISNGVTWHRAVLPNDILEFAGVIGIQIAVRHFDFVKLLRTEKSPELPYAPLLPLLRIAVRFSVAGVSWALPRDPIGLYCAQLCLSRNSHKPRRIQVCLVIWSV